MARLVDVMNQNIYLIEKLLKIGKLPLSLMNDYDIYLKYNSISEETSKMNKYNIVAKKLKCSPHTVRRAVYSMEKLV